MSLATRMGHGLALVFLLTLGVPIILVAYTVVFVVMVARSIRRPYAGLTRRQSVWVEVKTLGQCLWYTPITWALRLRFHWRAMVDGIEEEVLV